MTYETAIDWILVNLPPQDYDNFFDWYRAVDGKIQTPTLMNNSTFNRMLEQVWENTTGEIPSEPKPTLPRSQTREIRNPVNRFVFAPIKSIEQRQMEKTPVELQKQIPFHEGAPEIPKPSFPESKREGAFKRALNRLFRRKQ